ncbi:hypothetical protein [Spirosoma radiotolerans]|uniref:Uncharacterized protein n=1 Tax=Spirosoma radiotolerans TaxID=1379870 RepID=A0A0E3V8J9_9BACT|nr:hypothetical protein [Spirosoma radiotolerans]AKD56376.1 hypothetical protein SD10_17130 [Spirosoma radiotolerans]
MNRFSVIYLLRQQFHHIYSTTQAEAETVLQHLLTQKDHEPIGIYDAKTELFYWEPKRQIMYDQAPIEEQGPLGDQITAIAKSLRQQNNTQQPEETTAPEAVDATR